MPRTPETPIAIDERYRSSLREAVTRAGGQSAVATFIEVDQATISRTLAVGGRATYTTLKKMSDALGAPAPVYPVRDEEHAEWCRIGAELAEHDPEEFAVILRQARREAGRIVTDPKLAVPPAAEISPPTTEAVKQLKSVITNPLPGKRKKPDRGG